MSVLKLNNATTMPNISLSPTLICTPTLQGDRRYWKFFTYQKNIPNLYTEKKI